MCRDIEPGQACPTANQKQVLCYPGTPHYVLDKSENSVNKRAWWREQVDIPD